MHYVFLNQHSIVVNVIVGELTAEQLGIFLDDYAKLFGATQVVAVDAQTVVWIGGAYAGGEFLPPAEPEPEQPPELIEIGTEGIVEEKTQPE
jgi:hypothetical protein